MFLRCAVLLILSANFGFCDSFTRYTTQEHLKRLIDRKNATQKHEGINKAFDYLAECTEELLAELEDEDPTKKDPDSNTEKRQATINMIASNMANMEKLLKIMCSPEPEPLWQDYCTKRCDDPSWVALCNRQAKKIPQLKKRNEEIEDSEDEKVVNRNRKNSSTNETEEFLGSE